MGGRDFYLIAISFFFHYYGFLLLPPFFIMNVSTRERLLGFVQKRIMTDDGWRYFCCECNEYHHIDEFYKAPGRPFGIFSSCSKSKTKNKTRASKKDQSLNSVDVSHLKLNKVQERDIENTIEFLEKIGYDTTGNVHQQFMKKYEKQIQEALSKRPQNPKLPINSSTKSGMAKQK